MGSRIVWSRPWVTTLYVSGSENGEMSRKTGLPSCEETAVLVPAAERIDGVMAFSIRPASDVMARYSMNFASDHGESNKNLAFLSTQLGIAPARIVSSCQTHSDTVAIVDSVPRTMPDADAIISTTPGVFPAIKTADCLAILVLAPDRRIAAAIHAGWRGTVKRIARKVVLTLLEKFKCDATELLVALGPVIGPCCYEVDDARADSVSEGNPRTGPIHRSTAARPIYGAGSILVLPPESFGSEPVRTRGTRRY